MTREAKIGMLTGLGVIVLVGVLLSEYLGTPAGTTSTTGRMASLPLGQSYRNEVMQPVGVPGTVRPEAPVVGGALASGPAQLSSSGTTDVPAAYASMDTRDMPAIAPPGAPVLAPPVVAVPAGQVQPLQIADNRIPTINLGDKTQDTVYVAGQAPIAAPPVAPAAVLPVVVAPRGDTYTIASGDSLPKIAKKYYHSSKNSDVQRIVAANPTVLKNANTVLMVGKKLFIPSIAKAPAAVVQPPVTPVVVAPPVALKANSKTSAPTTYVVKDGDSLGKIAHELFPGNAATMVKKIMSANGIKNANDIHAGDKLKIPDLTK